MAVSRGHGSCTHGDGCSSCQEDWKEISKLRAETSSLRHEIAKLKPNWNAPKPVAQVKLNFASLFEALSRDLIAPMSVPPDNFDLDAELPMPDGDVEAARRYLIETATPGATMQLQGPELAMSRLHPTFVVRLAGAIREARAAGLSEVGCFSAYRPPAFGVGGFKDRWLSTHSYGLACDMVGIGRPESKEASLWHAIATRHGLHNPYPARIEWNHYQAVPLSQISGSHPLRDTITADGPKDLESMWAAAAAPAHDFYRQKISKKVGKAKKTK